MSEACLRHKFIATDCASKIISRSVVYSDIAASSWGPVFPRLASPTPMQQCRFRNSEGLRLPL
jgi:hypothetical protein